MGHEGCTDKHHHSNHSTKVHSTETAQDGRIIDLSQAFTKDSRYQDFLDLMQSRVLLMDGAMGTSLQGKNLTAKDFGGEALDGCNENLNFTRPDVILEIHEEYLQAGADIIETNTFGSTPLVMAEYDLQDKAFEVSKVAAQLASQAAKKFSTPSRPRFVAGSIGPTTKAISVTGGVSFQELVHSYTVQIQGLLEGGIDIILIETTQDTINMRAALEGSHKAMLECGIYRPAIISVTIEPMGTMLAGQSIEAVLTSMAHLPLIGFGMNCSTGPQFMTSHVRALSEISPFPVFCMPNAGLPNEDGEYDESPQQMGEVLGKFAEHKWLNITGGCCGTSPEYINHFDKIREEFTPRPLSFRKGSYVSGIEFLEIEDDNRPLLVGERTNSIGSRKFKKLIGEGKLEQASEIGRKQIKGGAQILDVCLANPDRDELEDMKAFLPEVIQKVKAPIMVDSTEDEVFELAVQMLPGKCILNSVNLEEGEVRFERVSKIVRRHGGALVMGCIDEDPEQGMGVSKERKLEIATRSYELLTNKYGIPEEDIIFDPLVFPCGTGDEQYLHSAGETIEGIRLIKEKYPRTKTILGISNVSFGLPNAGREILNSVFLYHCTKAGLDLAIVNSQKIERFSSIGEKERELCDALIFNNSKEAVEQFAEYFREMKPKKSADEMAGLTVEEKLKVLLVEGSKEGLIGYLDEALKKYTPLEVINIPLMDGMAEVGRLFNDNELIVAEVLQSAGVMKAAVTHLEQFMEKADEAGKAKMLLATVKGDVHDIGKNLVDIILSNNGFDIINLGIKVTSEELIRAYEEHKPDFIGLSGLLVKSAMEMVNTAEDLKAAGVDVPVLVGGAALSRSFCDKRIQPMYDGQILYSVDAMTGLDIANALADEAKTEAFINNYREESKRVMEKVSERKKPVKKREKLVIDHSEVRESAPDFDRHVVADCSAEELFPYINEQFFYTQHMGFRGSIRISREKGDERAVKLYDQVEALKKEVIENDWFDCKAVYQYFEAASEGEKLHLYKPGTDEIVRSIDLPRQKDGEEISAADFVAPVGHREKRDTVAMFAVTSGNRVRDLALKFKDEGEFFKSHAIQALAVETAEAMAEWLHQKIREGWGIEEDLSLKDLVQTKYQGIRFSFGYPACPDLEDQQIIFDLLKPEEVGIQLTESFMMEPEGSVSAIVFSHPQGKYFSVDE